jgi:hypothetical protein
MLGFGSSVRAFAVLVAFSASATASAATPPVPAELELEYPELAVTPRASDRLKTEAKDESSRAWVTYLPTQVSALATLTAGFLQTGNADPSKDPGTHSPLAGISVGGVWLGTTVAMAALYRPYTSGANEIAAMPAGGKRDQLARERAAESDLEAPARLARRLMWLSALSNFGANIYMATQAQSGSISVVADAIGAGLALAPIVFQYRWQEVASEQRDYKKRIYAPLAAPTIFHEPATGHEAPGAILAWEF